MNFSLGLLVGLLVGLVAGVSFASPVFGRAVTKLLAVVLIGLGVAALVWPLALGETGEPLRGPFGTGIIEYRSEAFAWAGGLLAGGVLATVFAFVGRHGKAE